jgi:hypothetical protein
MCKTKTRKSTKFKISIRAPTLSLKCSRWIVDIVLALVIINKL